MPPALVLAAGRSTRIAPVANGVPKPLLDVGGRTPLEWNLSWLAGEGVRDVWINLHHEADRFRAAIGDGAAYDIRVRYSFEPVLLGTAGAWRALADRWSETSLVIYGDNIMRFDLGGLLETHRRSGCVATMAVFDPELHAHTGSGGGRARVHAGRVVAFDERGGEADLPVNAGAYALEPGAVEAIGAGFRDFGHDVMPRLAAAGALAAHTLEGSGFCLGVDTPARYAEAMRLVAAGEVAP